MQQKPRLAPLVLFMGFAGLPSVTKADRGGVEYAVDAGVLVSGGIRFYPQSQNPEDMHTLRKRLPGSSADEVFFESEGTLANIQASPRGDLVGVLELSSESNVSPGRSNYVGRHYDEDGNPIEVHYLVESTLRILNLDGDSLAAISDVQTYSWGPDGRQIAYITGTEYEGGFGFLTTGTWVYNLATRKSKRVHSGGYDIQWASWDDRIYIYDPFGEESPAASVFRYDLDAQELIATSHKGIYFSADGRYYFAQGYEGSPLRVFETASENEVSIDLQLASPGRTQVREAFTATGWSDVDTLIIPSPIPGDRGDYLYGIGARTMWQANGLVMPARRPGNNVLVLQGTAIVERARSELSVVR